MLGFYDKISEGEVNILPPPFDPGIGLKGHTINKVHFDSHLNNETTKKNYFEKFIEEVAFVELSTQAKHLKVWILHDD